MKELRSAYEQGLGCGKAKRKMAGKESFTHDQLDVAGDMYRGLSAVEKSKWFADFYLGISDALKEGKNEH